MLEDIELRIKQNGQIIFRKLLTETGFHGEREGASWTKWKVIPYHVGKDPT
jgi:hypothetical protein